MCIGDFIRRLHFRNEEFHELSENEKRAIAQPSFSCYYFSIFLETHIQTRKLRAVSVFVSYPPFSDSIFRQTNTPFSQNRQYPTPFYLSVLYYHGNPRLLRESILSPANTQIPMALFLNCRLYSRRQCRSFQGWRYHLT